MEKEKIKEFAYLIKQPARVSQDSYFFKSVGMALFDLATAIAIYELAKTESFGIQMDF